MAGQRFVDRPSAGAACAVPASGTRPVRPVDRDPFPLSSCRARRADRGWPSATEMCRFTAQGRHDRPVRHTQGRASSTHPILSKAVRPTHPRPTPRWLFHLQFQRGSTVANHPEIKSQAWLLVRRRRGRLAFHGPTGGKLEGGCGATDRHPVGHPAALGERSRPAHLAGS